MKKKEAVSQMHKEEQKHRILLDSKDRNELKESLANYLNPLQYENHAEKKRIVNIFSGKIDRDEINVGESSEIRSKKMEGQNLERPSC